MHLGILLSSGLAIESWESGFETAKEMGYTHVELAANDVEGKGTKPDLGQCPDSAEAAEVVNLARSKGLEVSAFQCHQNLLFDDRDRAERSVAHTERMIDFAAATHVPVVHTTTGKLPEKMSPEEAWEILVRSYRRLCSHAEGMGVKVAIEPVFVYFVGNLSGLQELYSRVGRDDFYMNYDPSHFPFHDESPLPPIEKLGSRIVHAHAKDATVTPDPKGEAKGTEYEMSGGRKFAFSVPAKGMLDQVAIIRALKTAGFDGVLSLELGHGIPDQERLARENVPYLRRVFDEVGV